jgi:hypothetical protein
MWKGFAKQRQRPLFSAASSQRPRFWFVISKAKAQDQDRRLAENLIKRRIEAGLQAEDHSNSYQAFTTP